MRGVTFSEELKCCKNWASEGIKLGNNEVVTRSKWESENGVRVKVFC